jgi:hypothetical protein
MAVANGSQLSYSKAVKPASLQAVMSASRKASLQAN